MRPKTTVYKNHFKLLSGGALLFLLGAFSKPAAAAVVYADPYYYQRPGYPAPAYAAPNAAALGPWKWNFDFGGGPTVVTGNARQDINNGWNFTAGAGYNITPKFGWVIEIMNDGFGITDSKLQSNNQAIDGRAAVWAATFNPIYRFRISGPVGGYIIGGGGFYEREERFTEPGNVFIPTFHGGFYQPGYVDNHEYDDTGGVNIGAGLTWNLGWGTKFFAEARYHYLFTSGGGTGIVPITFGLRW